jgi:hypothetical protein
MRKKEKLYYSTAGTNAKAMFKRNSFLTEKYTIKIPAYTVQLMMSSDSESTEPSPNGLGSIPWQPSKQQQEEGSQRHPQRTCFCVKSRNHQK